jgi:hypothetical protein
MRLDGGVHCRHCGDGRGVGGEIHRRHLIAFHRRHLVAGGRRGQREQPDARIEVQHRAFEVAQDFVDQRLQQVPVALEEGPGRMRDIDGRLTGRPHPVDDPWRAPDRRDEAAVAGH